MSWAVFESCRRTLLYCMYQIRSVRRASKVATVALSESGGEGGGGADIRDDEGFSWKEMGGRGGCVLDLEADLDGAVSRESAAVDAREKGCTTMIMSEVS